MNDKHEFPSISLRYEFPSKEHLLKSISQKYTNLDDIVLDYINLNDPSNNYLSIIIENFNLICFCSEGFSSKFIEKIDFRSKERIEIIKVLSFRYQNLTSKIVSSSVISFAEAESIFLDPSKNYSTNTKNSLGISLIKRNDCSPENELKTFQELSKNTLDLYSYLSIFQNYFFKNQESIDFLIDSILEQGISSNTRIVFINNFLDHPQSKNKHKVLFLEALSKLKKSIIDKSSYGNLLDEVYLKIRESLDDDSLSIIAKKLW